VSDQPSPAERYAASRQRARHPELGVFERARGVRLDPFQREACLSVETGRSVLVAAPTGAGKTLVAEFAIHLAMRSAAGKVFYTTPMKALSNQKYHDLVAAYGPDEVGLLTGDSNVNSRARIVVMTTEVLRNMLYADSELLPDLASVILDEVHYLGDRFRGPVWEEVIIHLPPHVQTVSLSATVSNAEEFGDWLQAVRGDTDVVVSEERPVPLQQHVALRGRLVDLFEPGGRTGGTRRVNAELVRLARPSGRAAASRRGRGPRGGRRPGAHDQGRIGHAELVDLLDEHELLPAIVFIFSRAGCDQAVGRMLASGVVLTERSEQEEIRAIVEERCRTLLDEDLAVLGYWDWLRGLERGIAAHHAGLLPAFKETVEDLFRRKLVKLVFATETLALGVNMPARSVVLDKLEKFNGETVAPVTPGEYTQLTGRAGRRGIDVEGHSVIRWQNGLDPQAVASLASRRSYPLNSAFRPTYNMAVNLIDRFGRERTRAILESSFAQFQADRAVADLARTVQQQERSLDGYAASMRCDRGDFADYAALRRALSDAEKTMRGVRTDPARTAEQSARVQELRERLRAHPCHDCPDRETHARWAERWWRLRRDTDRLERRIRERTGEVAKIFDRVSDVLLECGYLAPATEQEGEEVAPTVHGRVLSRIYGERDLLVAECIRRNTWRELDAPGLAAIAAALVYEPRGREVEGAPTRVPSRPFRIALQKTLERWAILDDAERAHRLPGSEPPSTALCPAMFDWARGGGLGRVLIEADMAAGDFVRVAKQVIDLLDQVALVAAGPVGRTARQAVDAVRRGIVAYTSLEW